MPAGPAPTMARRSLVTGFLTVLMVSIRPRRGHSTSECRSARSLDDRLCEPGERLLDRAVGEGLESLHRPVGPAVRLGECIGSHLVTAQLGDGGREVGMD